MQHIIARNLMRAALPALLVAAPAMAAAGSSPVETAADGTSTAQAPQAYGITVETENLTFKYSYPKTLGRERALSDYLNQNGYKEMMNFAADTDRDHAEAANSNGAYTPHPYQYQVDWNEVAEIPAYISLSREWYNYMGGAHGMHGTDSLLWDKSSSAAVEPLTLFSGAGQFDQALQTEFCAQLDIQRAEKRGHPIARGSGADGDNSFEQCITPSAQTIILGSAQGKSFDTVSINVGPYEAGPYVEGSYQVDLPVTKAIISAVKPEHRSHFAVKR